MCLAVPAQIIQQEGDRAVVDFHGNHVAVSTILTPEAILGDWVLVHAGFAIQRLDAKAAAENFAILDDLAQFAAEPVVAGPPLKGASHA